MTFIEIVRGIELYLHTKGRESRHLIKDFVNESVRDFCRLDNWKKLLVADTLTLDGSDSYALTAANLTNNFEREIGLFLPYSSTDNTDITEYTKYEYATYIQLSSKDRVWAILGATLYVTGSSGDLNFFYVSPGDFSNYPLSDDTDEIPALIYYDDIIKKMTVIKYLELIKDEESLAIEQRLFQTKILSLKRAEKLGDHAGKFKMIRRGGLR